MSRRNDGAFYLRSDNDTLKTWVACGWHFKQWNPPDVNIPSETGAFSVSLFLFKGGGIICCDVCRHNGKAPLDNMRRKSVNTVFN